MKSILLVVQNLLKPYIDRKDRAAEGLIAPVETDATKASKAYSIGDQLILADVLYDVTANIAKDDALTIGTNITAADDIVTQLKNSGVTTDAVPTKNSTAPVQSGGVYDAEQDIYEAMGQNGAKNLLEITERFVKNPPASTYRVKSFSEYGIVIDGTVSTAQNMRISPADDDTSFILPAGDYVLSNDGGALPTGLTITVRKNGNALVSENSLATPYEFSANGTDYFVVLIHEAAATYTDATVSPMIRLASDTDATFRPYAKTNKELTDDIATLKTSKVNTSDIADNLTTSTAGKVLDARQGKALNDALANEAKTRSIMGAKNLFYYDRTPTGANGLTVTVNADNSITVSGTASAHTWIQLSDFYLDGSFIGSGCPEGGSADTYQLQFVRRNTAGTADEEVYRDNGEGVDITTYSDRKLRPIIYVKSGVDMGTDATAKVFYPMIRLATDANADYQPYAKTNKELMDDSYQITDTAEITLDDADYVPFYDASATAKRKSLWSNIKSVLKTYFDTLYATSTEVTNKHSVSTKTVSISSWTTDTSSQSGTTLYKKSISLSHVYVPSPSVDIGTSSGTGLPTAAQQIAYDLVQYATVDGTTLYLYASAIPSTTFYIQIEGAD